MANTKISALTSATTPLAGTEVLPIVQSSATVKVATNDLTVRNIRANATTGILQVTGPAAASTRVMTVPDANFTAARTDAAQSFTGNQTLSTGNLIIGTSGQGIDFSATSHPAGMTSELLADYEEGTWTPIFLPETNSFTSITYNTQSGRYTKIGRVVYFDFSLRTASLTIGTATDALRISGLPFTVSGASQSTATVGISESWGGDFPSTAFIRGGTQLVSMLYRTTANGGTLSIQVSDMSTSASANEISGGGFYVV